MGSGYGEYLLLSVGGGWALIGFGPSAKTSIIIIIIIIEHTVFIRTSRYVKAVHFIDVFPDLSFFKLILLNQRFSTLTLGIE